MPAAPPAAPGSAAAGAAALRVASSGPTPPGGSGAPRCAEASHVPSRDSQLVLRRLTTNLRPLLLEWRDLGCSYDTAQGPKTVLQASGSLPRWRGGGWQCARRGEGHQQSGRPY